MLRKLCLNSASYFQIQILLKYKYRLHSKMDSLFEKKKSFNWRYGPKSNKTPENIRNSVNTLYAIGLKCRSLIACPHSARHALRESTLVRLPCMHTLRIPIFNQWKSKRSDSVLWQSKITKSKDAIKNVNHTMIADRLGTVSLSTSATQLVWLHVNLSTGSQPSHLPQRLCHFESFC